jgi:hypothetical protein
MSPPADPPASAVTASWSGAVLAALLATLEQPSGWAVSLAGFLARGGLLAFLLPIVVLPTPAGLQADLSPLLRPLVFGETSPGLVLLGAGVVAIVAGAIVGGGVAGAWADRLLIRRVADALESPVAGMPVRSGTVVRVFLARLLAQLPLAVALAWGAVRIFEAAYRELVTPFEVVTPLVVRIVGAVPDALAVVGLAWLLGEAAGGLAAREVVLGGQGVGAAVVRGWRGLFRSVRSGAATLVLTTVVVVVAVVPALIASGTAWSRLRDTLYDGGSGEVPLALALFVALWLGGLVLAGVATAARSALWTAEWLRRAPAAHDPMAAVQRPVVGTIGDVNATDRGGWPSSEASGTL